MLACCLVASCFLHRVNEVYTVVCIVLRSEAHYKTTVFHLFKKKEVKERSQRKKSTFKNGGLEVGEKGAGIIRTVINKTMLLVFFIFSIEGILPSFIFFWCIQFFCFTYIKLLYGGIS